MLQQQTLDNFYEITSMNYAFFTYAIICFIITILLAVSTLVIGILIKDKDSRLKQFFSSTTMLVIYLVLTIVSWGLFISAFFLDSGNLDQQTNKVFATIEQDYDITMTQEQKESLAETLYQARSGTAQETFNITTKQDNGVKTLWFVTEPGATQFGVTMIK